MAKRDPRASEGPVCTKGTGEATRPAPGPLSAREEPLIPLAVGVTIDGTKLAVFLPIPMRRPLISPATSSQDALVDRARRMRRKGDRRKMLVALRNACVRNEDVAWIWTLYGARLAECGRVTEASAALGHALWLRRAAGDQPRMRSTKAILDGLRSAA